ncbi:glucoamylase family protein [Plantactinospora sp. GCM10030261]|uniref:glucoamylase family protein n=1 Tax=Plantactinospora sp. GCM10030261 TaxID=3273420 RepID=UPI00360AEDA0
MRSIPRLTVATVACVGLLVSSSTVAAAAPGADPASAADRRTVLRQYAADTWRSFTAMVDPRTGLVADNIGGDLDPADRSAYTSPTNVGSYLWSTVVARELRLIPAGEARARVSRTLDTLARLEIHKPSGMYYNWYDPATGAKLTTWPVDGSPVHPFLSSVDNGWLATALVIVKDQVPELARPADALLRRMDFGYYYNPAERQIRGGFWVAAPPGCSTPGNYRGGAEVYYTCHHYGAFNTEPRIASYLGIAAGQIPPEHYFGTFRTFAPEGCDWAWSEQRAVGEWRTYLGVRTFEGAYRYRGMQLVPTWGGSMFEALMVPLFVPEDKWGKRSWARNHPTYVQAQIEHGMREAGYGYWGFSPSNNPAGGYREYGVDAIGMDAAGYTSDQERTGVDYGYGECRPAQPLPTEYGQGVVTPHASFLALRYAEDEALRNLANLRRDFDAYGPGGFYDAINVSTGQASERYLSLDQGMIMAALGNALAHDVLREPFSTGDMVRRVAPLMRMEEFYLPAR